jgi:DNA-binding response OmpR family regulator
MTDFDRAVPWVDEYGTVHRSSLAMPLTRPEALVLRELLRYQGATVTQARLLQLLETSGLTASVRSLDDLVTRLRTSVSKLRIEIRCALPHGIAADVGRAADLAS